ncbi:hypothetical protein [Streptomyces antimycoticus]|uniref:hypothetical protein n=1 Tax=Streptomyces antimycoticus TaxID=68175 RepID=UPI00386AE2C6|nr:hypothetical protein OG751_39195 [Streptomyces antimycoticus]
MTWKIRAGLCHSHALFTGLFEFPFRVQPYVTGNFPFIVELDALLILGTPVKTVAPAGPGLPDRKSTRRILLVPQHPQTGERWLASTTVKTVSIASGWQAPCVEGRGADRQGPGLLLAAKGGHNDESREQLTDGDQAVQYVLQCAWLQAEHAGVGSGRGRLR